MTTTEDTGSGNGGVSSSTVGESGSSACVVGGGSGGGVIMENLIEKSLYDIGDPDLMDVWDTDLNAVSKKADNSRFMHEVAKVDAPTRRKSCCSTAVLHLSFWVPVACTRYQAELKR